MDNKKTQKESWVSKMTSLWENLATAWAHAKQKPRLKAFAILFCRVIHILTEIAVRIIVKWFTDKFL